MDEQVKIYFGGKLANLYELGWIAADLSQVIDFSELIEVGSKERAEKFFGEKSRPFNRYAAISARKEKRPEIVEVNKGSIELIIAGATLAAAIIMPLVQIAVSRYFEEKDEMVTFEISPQDRVLKGILRSYENGDFGSGHEGLQELMYQLAQHNYSTSFLSDNVYLIEHVIEKYSQRIIKTIKKNM